MPTNLPIMAKQPQRFSRKFLTLLMLLTAAAILLLSQTGTRDEAGRGEADTRQEQTGP